MATKLVNTAPLKNNIQTEDGLSATWSAYFRDLGATLQFDPTVNNLTGSVNLVGTGFKLGSTLNLTVNITGQSSSVLQSTTLTLPFVAFSDGFLNVFDSTNGIMAYIGCGFIPANTNICWLPSWTNKQNISLVGTYRLVVSR